MFYRLSKGLSRICEMRVKNIMKNLIRGLFCCMVILMGYSAHAGSWDQCKGCHDGAFAPDAKALKQKYKTVDDLIKAAKKSDEPLMNRYKQDEEFLRKAAKDIGLQ